MVCKDTFFPSTHKTRRPNRSTVQQVGPAWQGLRAQFRQLIPDCHRHSTIPRENSHSLFHLNEKMGNVVWTVVGKLKYMLCPRFLKGVVERFGVNGIKWSFWRLVSIKRGNLKKGKHAHPSHKETPSHSGNTSVHNMLNGTGKGKLKWKYVHGSSCLFQSLYKSLYAFFFYFV